MNLARLLWAVAAVLMAAAVGASYLDRRNDETSSATTVFVAKQLIPAGTLVLPPMFRPLAVRPDEVPAGTLTDIKVIALSRVASSIYLGEWLKVSDFTTTTNRS